MAKPVSCPRCNVPMVSLPERLDLSPSAGHVRPADLPFRGILADVFQCPSCRAVGTRPTSLAIPSAIDRASGIAAVA